MIKRQLLQLFKNNLRNDEGYIRRRQEHTEFKRLSDKPLLFGIEEVLSYKGHSAQIVKLIQNTNNKVYASCDLNTIHFWSSKGKKKAKVIKLVDLTKTHSEVSAIAFSNKYRLYLVISKDFKFVFINELYNVVDITDMSEIRLVSNAYFHDDADELIVSGINGAFVFDFQYQGSYQPDQAARVDMKGSHIKIKLKNQRPLEKVAKWCKGIRVNSNVIITWNMEHVQMNSLQGKLLHQFNDLTKGDVKVMDVLIIQRLNYFLTANSEGNICVHKLNMENQGIMHTFHGHKKACVSINEFSSNLIISASLDSTARIWCIQTFTHHYTFQLSSGLSYIKLFNEGRNIICGRSDSVLVYKLNMVVDHYLSVDNKVISLQPGFSTVADKRICNPSFAICHCGDNSVFLKHEDRKVTLFPPPNAQVIVKVMQSFSLNKVAALFQNQSIAIYSQQSDSAVIDLIISKKDVKDCEGIPAIQQDITCIEMIQTQCELVPIDSEILHQKAHSMSVDARASEFMVMGLSGGTVVIISMLQLNRVFARFTLHKTKVVWVHYLPSNTFVSFCEENQLVFWRLELGSIRPTVLFKFQMSKPIIRLQVIGDLLLFQFEHGETELFQFDGSLYWVETEKTREYDTAVTACDYNSHLRLLVTAGDCVIRLWTEHKKFLREIQFPDRVDGACFVSKSGDLVVAHGQRVSVVTMRKYWSRVFDYYGITDSKEHPDFEDQQSLYSDHDFKMGPEEITKVLVQNDIDLDKIFSLKPNVIAQSPQESEKPVTICQEDNQDEVVFEESIGPQEQADGVYTTAEPENIEVTHQKLKERKIKEAQEFKQKLVDLSPFNKPAIFKHKYQAANFKPLPQMSYLTTSPSYYEMIGSKAKKVKKPTRRTLTEERICQNIMAFNTLTAEPKLHDMQVSPQFQTQVSQSKYVLSLGSNSKGFDTPLPLEFLLKKDLGQIQQRYLQHMASTLAQHESIYSDNVSAVSHKEPSLPKQIEDQRQISNMSMNSTLSHIFKLPTIGPNTSNDTTLIHTERDIMESLKLKHNNFSFGSPKNQRNRAAWQVQSLANPVITRSINVSLRPETKRLETIVTDSVPATPFDPKICIRSSIRYPEKIIESERGSPLHFYSSHILNPKLVLKSQSLDPRFKRTQPKKQLLPMSLNEIGGSLQVKGSQFA